MKGEGEAIIRTLWLIFVFVVSALAIVLLVVYIGSFGSTECWRNTISELRPITGAFEEKTFNLGKLLGREEFTIGLTLNSKCVDRIIFDDLEACRDTCVGTDRFDPDEDACIEQCKYCLESEGCIIAVPRTPERFAEVINDKLDYFKMLRANIKVFNSPEFGFYIPRTFVSPQEGMDYKCLTFVKNGEKYEIKAVKSAETMAECDVTELGFS